MKNYQTSRLGAGNGRTTPKKAKVSTDQMAGEAAVSLPQSVTVAIAELAGEMQEGILALVVNAGLRVIDALFEEEASSLAGPKGRHDPNRSAVRHGTDDGLVTLGARRLQIRRPRLRSADGQTEVPLSTYEWAKDTELLERETMSRMLAKLSCRRYGVGLEPMGEAIKNKSRSVSKSAVSRRFVAATETALAELMSRRLDDLDLVAFMVDGVHFGEHTCVVALGIGIDGTKHPLAVEEGSTENATLVTDLITGLRDRGLDVTRPVLAVLDGAKALTSAVKKVFDKPVIQRCQQHKIANVRDKLPDKLRAVTEKRMRHAYHAESGLKAEAELEALARELGKTHPGAAASLREGMAETLTILRLGVPPTLARTLRSTNSIESMIEICREHSKNVKRWRDGTMALRWCAAGMIEAGHQFRRVNGHLHLPKLRAALDAHFTGNVTAVSQNEDQKAA